MYVERKQDLSVYYFIDKVFTDAGATNINIVDGFPTGELVLPTVAIDNDFLTTRYFELGNRRRLDIRTWYIDIFTENKSRRDEFAYLIKNEVQNKIPVYDYDEGFPPPTPTQIGVLDVMEISMRPIRVLPELVSTLYWRAQVKIIAYYEAI